MAAYAVSTLAGGGVASIAQSLELQEAKESEEDCVRRNIGLVNEMEDFVGYEHLCELFSDSRSYCMLVIVH